MKKFLMITLFMAFALVSFGQSKTQYIYCEIVGTQKFMSPKKVTVEIDYGQKTKFAESQKLRDEEGKAIVFNSMVDAMNWMGDKGWEFCQAYVVTYQNNNIYHWLLKMDISGLTAEEIAAIKAAFKTDKNK